MFEIARERGRGDRIGQLNPTGRYGVPEGACMIPLLRRDLSRKVGNGKNTAAIPLRKAWIL